MKIVYFLTNGIATPEDKDRAESFKAKGNKCKFSNGSAPYGFEDSCDAVYLASDFPHIEKWAVSKGVQVMKPEPAVVAKPDPEPVEPEQTPEPKPKRAGRPKTTPSE